MPVAPPVELSVPVNFSGVEVLATTTTRSRPTGASPQQGQAVLGLRVREESARVYLGDSETNVPMQLEAETTPPGGPTGYDSTSEVWLDHAYLGDGWWYMPREAVEVTVNGDTQLLGRLDREGIEWDDNNRFRPTSDVDERDTRDESIPLDWTYHHWKGVPVQTGEPATVEVVPTDHDTWLARLILFDQAIGVVAYCNDAQAVAHWRSRARNEWSLAGIALWSLGQEDVRLWDTLAGGELAADTKILNE